MRVTQKEQKFLVLPKENKDVPIPIIIVENKEHLKFQ